MDTDIIVALISLFAGMGGVLLGGWLQKRKTNAEADQATADANKAITETVMTLITPLNNRITELSKEVGNLKGQLNRAYSRIEYLLDGIKRLTQQLADLDKKPCWSPDEDDPI